MGVEIKVAYAYLESVKILFYHFEFMFTEIESFHFQKKILKELEKSSFIMKVFIKFAFKQTSATA